MTIWGLMIEIIWYSSTDLQNYNRNNGAFKCIFLAMANVRLRSIQGYNKRPIKTRRFGHSKLTGEKFRFGPLRTHCIGESPTKANSGPK